MLREGRSSVGVALNRAHLVAAEHNEVRVFSDNRLGDSRARQISQLRIRLVWGDHIVDPTSAALLN